MRNDNQAQMKLSHHITSHSGDFRALASRIAGLERAGLDIVWVSEAYGVDAVSRLAYLAALIDKLQIGSGILPIYTRTPALLAQTAAGLDYVSNGRFILGLGASGAQGATPVGPEDPARTIERVKQMSL